MDLVWLSRQGQALEHSHQFGLIFESYLFKCLVNIDNIYELCDVIASCRKYICGFSGTACLASAIKKDDIAPKIHCLCYNRVQEHWCIFGFPNIDYINVKP